MKRTISIVMVAAMMAILLVACGGKATYRSIRHTDSGKLITLTQSTKDEVDALLGKDVYNEALDTYQYLDGAVQIQYYDNIVIYMEGTANAIKSFTFYNYAEDMTLADVQKNYPDETKGTTLVYNTAGYDEKGKATESDEPAYSGCIILEGNKFGGFYLSADAYIEENVPYKRVTHREIRFEYPRNATYSKNDEGTIITIKLDDLGSQIQILALDQSEYSDVIRKINFEMGMGSLIDSFKIKVDDAGTQTVDIDGSVAQTVSGTRDTTQVTMYQFLTSEYGYSIIYEKANGADEATRDAEFEHLMSSLHIIYPTTIELS